MKYPGVLAVIALLIAGCTSPVATNATNATSSETTFEIQGKTYDEVWSTIERIAGQNLAITERIKALGLLKATRGVVMGPWGYEVEFSVSPAHNGAAEYTVELEITEQPDSKLPASDWENTVVNQIKSELGQ